MPLPIADDPLGVYEPSENIKNYMSISEAIDALAENFTTRAFTISWIESAVERGALLTAAKFVQLSTKEDRFAHTIVSSSQDLLIRCGVSCSGATNYSCRIDNSKGHPFSYNFPLQEDKDIYCEIFQKSTLEQNILNLFWLDGYREPLIINRQICYYDLYIFKKSIFYFKDKSGKLTPPEKSKNESSTAIFVSGRATKYKWDDLWASLLVEAEFDEIGLDSERGMQAKLENKISEWFVQNGFEQPSISDIRLKAQAVIRALIKRNAGR